MNYKHTIATVSVGLVGIVAFAGSASAADPTTTDSTPAPVSTRAPKHVDVDSLKARCDAAITERQVELDKLMRQADSDKTLSSPHHSTIASMISASKSGLGDLKAKIDGDIDRAALKTDCQNIYAGFRVFALRAPQVHLAIVGDREGTVVGKGNAAVTRLDAAIQKAAGKGKDVTDAKAKLTDMKNKLADATTLLNGVVDKELTFTPGEWNLSHDVLKPSNTAIRSAHLDLKGAFADAKGIVADLKA